MNILSGLTRRLALLIVSTVALAGAGDAFAAAPDHLVITQVYGGGGGSSASAPFNQDYVEIFNPTSAGVTLSGLSLQYASTTGNFGSTSSNVFALPSVTLQPGQFYLVAGPMGTNSPAVSPAPDSTANFAIAQGGGKIALINGTAGNLPGTTCSGGNIIDEVSFATSVSCQEGTAPAPAITVSTASYRKNICADTDDNATEFGTEAPAPHNASSPLAPCGSTGTSLGVASASATPASVTAGSATTLSVTVTPGPASTGIAVTADLSGVGGSASQAFMPSGTANVYTYTLNVGASVAANSYALPVTLTDQQGESASGSIALTVAAPVTVTPIATLQSNRATYVNTKVTTTGVVTLTTNAGFFIQTPSSTPGSTGAAEGLYVYAGSGKVPASAAVGNNINVTGTLSYFPDPTASHTPSLELASPAVTVNSTGNPLPPAITVSGKPTPTGGIYQLTRYEGMLVKFASLTAISPTDGSLTESTETVTSTGQFFVTVTGMPRPFREPGMDFRDFPATTCPTLTNCTSTATTAGVARPANLTLYDDNPERLIVESSLGGGTPFDVSSGAVITNATGVIDFSYATDVPYGDPARLILVPGTLTPSNYTPGISVTPLPVPGAGQFTVAAFNVERFFNPNAADNKYFNPATGNVSNSSAVNVTADAYARRLKKVSLAIRNVLNMPDILSIEEVENVSVLKDIAAQIDTDAAAAGQTPPHYAAYGTDSVTTFTNDVGGISIGFLVKPATANVVSFEQMGNTSTFQASTGQQTLNDRPSDVLHATINRGTGVAPYPITVISNHLRSLSGINISADTRMKKELQAEMLATLIQGYQTKGEHVIAVGDMNAFEFSDGYTDTLGTITGNVGNNVAAQPGKAITSPAAVDLITLLPPDKRQSYVEFGNAQVLDHAVVTADLAGSSTLAVAHFDSDFPNILVNDATTPARISDHDVPLTYITMPTPQVKGALSGIGVFPSTTIGATSDGQIATLTNTGEAPLAITTIAATGDFAESNNCPSSLAVGATCAVNVVFRPTASGYRTGRLTVAANGSIAPLALEGTAPLKLTLGNGFADLLVTFELGVRETVTVKLTTAKGFAGSVNFSCPLGATMWTNACSVTPSLDSLLRQLR